MMISQILSLVVVALAGAGVVVAQATAPGPTHAGIAANCNKFHLANQGDDCSKIEAQYKISHAQFISWNPAVSSDCLTNFWGGYAYCVGVGAVTASSSTTKPTTSPTSSVSITPPNITKTTSTTTASSATRVTTPPGPTFTGTPGNCNSWHLVKGGETCNTVLKLYGLTLDVFRQYNPAVSSDCTANFWADYAYCVGLGPFISSTSTKTFTSSSATVSTPYSIRHPTTTWVITTPTLDDSTWPPTKTQAGQPSYCSNWHPVSGEDDCESIAFSYKTWMSLADFFAWNPAVGTDCTGLVQYTWVCVEIQPQVIVTIEFPAAGNITIPPYVSYTPPPLPTVDTSFSPTPSHGPMPGNCLVFATGDKAGSCDVILTEHAEITKEQFFKWNPVLGGLCANVRKEYYYCVGAYSSSKEFPQPPTVSTKPVGVAGDTVGSCVAWYFTTPGDTCAVVEMMFGTFSQANFKTWNPSVGSDCSGLKVRDIGFGEDWGKANKGLDQQMVLCCRPGNAYIQDGHWHANDNAPTEYFDHGKIQQHVVSDREVFKHEYDVGAFDNNDGQTHSYAAASSGECFRLISDPKANMYSQGTMVEGCRRFYYVQQGDGCWQITNDAGISLESVPPESCPRLEISKLTISQRLLQMEFSCRARLYRDVVKCVCVCWYRRANKNVFGHAAQANIVLHTKGNLGKLGITNLDSNLKGLHAQQTRNLH